MDETTVGVGEVGREERGVDGVTVIIPVYNDVAHLRAALRSVCEQDYSPLEVIVVDDASTQDVAAVVRAFPSARLLTHPSNRGVAEALNTGLHNASHGLVCWVSSDDGAYDGKLGLQASVFADPSVVLCFTAYRNIRDNGTPIRDVGLWFGDGQIRGTFRVGTDGRVFRLAQRLAHMTLLVGDFINGSTVMFRRDAVLARSGFSSKWRYTQDYDMWLKLSEVGTLAYVDKVLGWRTEHPSQMSRDDGGTLADEEAWKLRSEYLTDEVLREMQQLLGSLRIGNWILGMPSALRDRCRAQVTPAMRCLLSMGPLWGPLRLANRWRARFVGQS